jgi:site-specific DNA-methyltransferase (adenine-specific)
MSVYYQDDYATLYHGDCIEVMSGLKLEADLLLTDPPYGVSYKSNWSNHAAIANDDGNADVMGMLATATKKLRRSRHAYIFGYWDFSGTNLTAHTQLIWDKGMIGMGDLSMPWGTSHESITFALHQPSKANRADGAGRLSARMRQGSVLRVDRTNGASSKRHPTEKPVALLRQLIESSSCFGDLVFDPFAGVGSTLVAASLEGRHSVGIEIEEKYCELAATRLSSLAATLKGCIV